MIDKIIDTIKNNNMLNQGDKVIVAVSGGPDSMCLLHVLMNLRDSFSLKLVAAHVNHGLRGSEADEDENYVREFCKINGIAFSSIKADIHKISIERNVSCETAGRDFRYEFFQKLKVENNADKIAIAHNLNDQAETVLMRIIRGAGLEGLGGIKPVREGVYIRPLLFCSRDEIEQYCINNNLEPRIDKTNFENIYARNKIRLELVPYIQKNFNRDIIGTLSRIAENSRVDSDYLEEISEKMYKRYCTIKEDRVIISKEGFLDHEAVVTRVIRKAFLCLIGNLNNFERLHICQILELQKGATGKMTMLPNELIAVNCYGDIHISRKIKELRASFDTNVVYNLHTGQNYIPDLGLKIIIGRIPYTGEQYPISENIKYFDGDKVSNNITLRFRRNGDRFNPLGMTGSRKLKDIFIDMKVPREERNMIPLICFNDNIGWIAGYKISNNFKIDSSTKEILIIKMEREEKQ